jgi:hypothetical protein
MNMHAFSERKIVLLFIVFLVLMLSLPAQGASPVGNVTYVEGKVDILRGGKPPAVPAKPGDQVAPGDIVRTKSRSKAEIALSDGTLLRIAQRSRIDIGEYVSGDLHAKSVITLQRGKANAIVHKSTAKRISVSPDANSFEIHTPNAVAGVRGTDFFIAYERRNTTVLLKEGAVCVYNIKLPNSESCLPPAFITVVSGDNPPENPRKAMQAEFLLFENETSPMVPVQRQAPDQASGAHLEEIVLAGISMPETTGEKDPVRPGLSAGTEAPTSLSDIPLSPPITEVIEPSPEAPPKKAESSLAGNIWSFYPAVTDGSFSAVLESTASLWGTTQAVPVQAEINGAYLKTSSQPHIWFDADVVSENSKNGTMTTYDGGAYRGFLGGREIDGIAEASFKGLYIDPSGNTGILTGNFTGTTGSSLDMTGGMYTVQLGTSIVSSGDFYNNVTTGSFGVAGEGSFGEAGSLSATSGINQTMNVTGQDAWGVSQILMSGTYEDSGTAWTMTIGNSQDPGYLFGGQINGTAWSENEMKGSLAGYWAEASGGTSATGIYIGETVGTFNPSDHTWQAISTAAWLRTEMLLQMASTAAGRQTLQQLNIPAFEVGRTDLSGSLYAEGDFVSIVINLPYGLRTT